jgi:general secretion pathway protein D
MMPALTMRTRSLTALLPLLLLIGYGCAGSAPKGKAHGTAAAPVAAPAPAPPAPAPEPAPVQEPAPVPEAAAVPREEPPPPAPAKPPERYVSLNFDNADIAVVVQTVAELLKMNYIVAPGVRGRVTIQTSEKLPVSSLPAVLEQILEVNALTAVKTGDFWKIVPAAQAKQEAVAMLAPDAAAAPGTGLVTKVVPLKFISPGEVVRIITPFKSQAGFYQAHEPTRLLLLTENPAKLAELMKIVDLLDVDSFASIQVDLVPVRYAAVEDLAKEITQLVQMIYTAAGRGKTLFRIVPVPAVNSIMVFSGENGLAASVRDWIAKLDQPASEANERIFVYPLSHANAESIAGILDKVFHKDSAAKTPVKTPSVPSGPRDMTARAAAAAAQAGAQAPGTAPAAATPAPVTVGDSISAATAAPVTIVADKDSNSLIIETTSWYYPVVESTIRRLDQMPRQVLIEVLIAEITLDDENQFGLQWAVQGQGNVTVFGETHALTSQTQNIYTKALGPLSPGLSMVVTEANRLTGVINAYAKDSKINVLSAPHIFATDNKEAKIDIGQEVPILKTRTTGTVGSDTSSTNQGTVTNDIEYRATGVILTVTPHINESGFVTLDVQQEVSEAQTNTLGGTDSPIILKRTAKTTMVVKDDQTLVIGGMIQQKNDKSREGIPLLSRIPILGYLFGTTDAKVHKTELVLLITPRVVKDVETGNRLTQELQNRTLTLKKGIEGFKKDTR